MLLVMRLRPALSVSLPQYLRRYCSYGQSGSTGRRYQSNKTTETAEPKLHISAGEDIKQLRRSLKPLLHSYGGRWSLTVDGKGLQRSFEFDTFKRTWDFMAAVAEKCKREQHHPEWSNVYNCTFIRWTTHKPEGLSLQDATMAAMCDEQARFFGEVQEVSDTKCPASLLMDSNHPRYLRIVHDPKIRYVPS